MGKMIKVAILLSYYNGGKYIYEQMDSLTKQIKDGVTIHIYIRDDGSNKSNIEVLKSIQKKYNVTIFFESNIGVIASFIDLLKRVEKYDFYAFCDQDDVWRNDKVVEAIRMISDFSQPALYCSAFTLASEDLKKTTEPTPINPSFENALFKNFCTGCTCVINSQLRNQILVSDFNSNVPMHDWWFLLIAYLTGVVVYDDKSYILYRQHGNNVVGGHVTFSQKAKRYLYGILLNESVRSRMFEQLLKTPEHYNEERTMLIKEFLISKNSIIKKVKLIKTFKCNYFNVIDSFLVRLLILLGRF